MIARNLSDGEKVSRLIEAEWKDKFRVAIPENTREVSRFYNELLIVRQQLRNFVAHGAFGKDGNAFQFHSKTGLVPVVMRHNLKRNRFSLHGDLSFEENEVIRLFVNYLFLLIFIKNGNVLATDFMSIFHTPKKTRRRTSKKSLKAIR